MTIKRAAVLGLGIMGSRMAGRLLQAGLNLVVYNRNPAKTDELHARGAAVAPTPRQAALQAELILSMVADDQASRAIWLGEDGALAGAAAGTILVESSTLTVGWIRELAEQANRRGCQLIDAPVTGSRSQAAAGELNFLVGGPVTAFEKAKPILQLMGRNVIHLGPTGSGALMKLINNFLAAAQVAALAQALAMIERSDLNPHQALSVLTSGAPGSPIVKMLAERMVNSDYTTNFALKHMAKDLNYALQEAASCSVDLSMARAALELFTQAQTAGLGERDFAAVVEPLRRK